MWKAILGGTFHCLYTDYVLVVSCVQVTFVADYTCHVHRDHQNISGGATAVFTITTEVQPVQLHVLHEYKFAKVYYFSSGVSKHNYQ